VENTGPKNKPMTRDEWMAWLEKSWAEAQARASTPEQKPVAHITGYYRGHCVIQPLDPAVVLPVGMALYRAPDVFKLIEDNGLTLHGDIEHFAELIRQEERQVVLDAIDALWGMERDRNDMFSEGYDYALGHIKEVVDSRSEQ